MRHRLAIAFLAALLGAAPVQADPGVQVQYRDELLRVTLNGSYQGSYYQVWRSGELAGEYRPLGSDLTLCTGDCYLTDLEARPGTTYWYRFDLQAADGSLASYGPYPVTVPDTPFGVRVSPNPSNRPVSVELALPGSARSDAPLRSRLSVLDVQGRTVRVLHDGPLSRGRNVFAWDGRAEDGRLLGAGLFFVRAQSPLGHTVVRLVRVR